MHENPQLKCRGSSFLSYNKKQITTHISKPPINKKSQTALLLLPNQNKRKITLTGHPFGGAVGDYNPWLSLEKWDPFSSGAIGG